MFGPDGVPGRRKFLGFSARKIRQVRCSMGVDVFTRPRRSLHLDALGFALRKFLLALGLENRNWLELSRLCVLIRPALWASGQQD